MATLIATPYLYSNYTFSFIYISSIYVWCIWRGGSFYIEIFSERYKLKFVTIPDDHKDEEEVKDAPIDLMATEGSELYEELVTAIRAATPAAVPDKPQVSRTISTGSSSAEETSKVNTESEEEEKKKSSSDSF